jgi:hypothetical protein
VVAFILILITTLISPSDTALAGTVVLSGTYSPQDIQGKCGGGTFSADGGSYSCQTKKGTVSCNWDGKCVGECNTCGSPAIAHKGGATIVGVLSGTTLKAGTSTQTKTAPKPIHVKQPVGDNNSIGTTNSEHQGKKK